MGQIARLRQITIARIEAFLAALEDPETVLPRLVAEMTEKVAQAANAESKAFTAVRADRRRLDAATGRLTRLEKGAVLALEAGEVETARQAIAAQITAEQDIAACQKRLEVSEAALDSARQAKKQLEEGLQDLKLRKEQILSRIRAIRLNRPLARRTLEPGIEECGGILDIVAGMETRLDEAESEIVIRDEIARTLGPTFQHERAKELEADAEVERRLSELKKQLGHD